MFSAIEALRWWFRTEEKKSMGLFKEIEIAYIKLYNIPKYWTKDLFSIYPKILIGNISNVGDRTSFVWRTSLLANLLLGGPLYTKDMWNMQNMQKVKIWRYAVTLFCLIDLWKKKRLGALGTHSWSWICYKEADWFVVSQCCWREYINICSGGLKNNYIYIYIHTFYFSYLTKTP